MCSPVSGERMFRVTFQVSESAERQLLASGLRTPVAGGGARVVLAFDDAKTVDVYLEILDPADPDVAAADLARHLGVADYEITEVEPLLTESTESADAGRRSPRPDAITQVLVNADDRTLSVQVRHRPYETAAAIEVVDETDDAVVITVVVSATDDHVGGQYASLAIVFTWVDIVLDRPLGNRKVIRHNPSYNPAPARTH
jgi:hypothetical protein